MVETMLKCRRCGHGWKSRLDRPPKRCPGCTATAWNRDLKRRGRKFGGKNKPKPAAATKPVEVTMVPTDDIMEGAMKQAREILRRINA
jgi:hypothetical protein